MASVGVLEPVERWLERLLLSMSSRGAAIKWEYTDRIVVSSQFPVASFQRQLWANGNY